MSTRPSASSICYTLVVSAGAVVLGIVSGAVVYMAFKKRKKEHIPTDWTEVGKIKQLNIYPMKSGHCIELNEAECTSLGLRSTASLKKELLLRDRAFVVYREETGDFLTARAQPRMLQIIVHPVSKLSVKFTFPGKEDVELELPTEGSAKKTYVQMWYKEKIPCLDCGDEIARWLSEVIYGQPNGLRLAYWGESSNNRRDVISVSKERANAFSKLRNEDSGAFSDLSSFMLMNESSLVDLNERVKDKQGVSWFSMKRFRPNIVVEGPKAYDEDNWDWIKIGDSAIFRNCKPCTRCSLTAIDPETGKRHPTKEPIKTLKTYRQLTDPVQRKSDGESPVLGVNMGLYSEGIIKVGDSVYITPKK